MCVCVCVLQMPDYPDKAHPPLGICVMILVILNVRFCFTLARFATSVLVVEMSFQSRLRFPFFAATIFSAGRVTMTTESCENGATTLSICL